MSAEGVGRDLLRLEILDEIVREATELRDAALRGEDAGVCDSALQGTSYSWQLYVSGCRLGICDHPGGNPLGTRLGSPS